MCPWGAGGKSSGPDQKSVDGVTEGASRASLREFSGTGSPGASFFKVINILHFVSEC